MARLPDAVEAGLSGGAAEIYEELMAKRGRIDGMYRTMLNHPRLTREVGTLGTFFRFGDSELPAAVREFIILHVAASLGIGYEWVKHREPARAAGLTDGIVEALRRGDLGSFDTRQRDLIAMADHALELRDIPQDLQDRVSAEVGVQGVLELVTLVGFYRLIAGVIACFAVPLPDGAINPFSDK